MSVLTGFQVPLKWERHNTMSNQIDAPVFHRKSLVMAPAHNADQSTNARKALKEAEQRRKRMDEEAQKKPTEKGGRGGPDPARYGDWEVKGVASDF